MQGLAIIVPHGNTMIALHGCAWSSLAVRHARKYDTLDALQVRELFEVVQLPLAHHQKRPLNCGNAGGGRFSLSQRDHLWDQAHLLRRSASNRQ
jgi:hypothetical protein